MAIKIVSKILKLLSPSERRSLYLLFPAVIATGFLEVAGIASIVPFLSLVSNPEAIQENRWLALAYNRLGFGNANQFLIFLGSAALVILTLSNVFTAFTTYHLTRFSYMRGYTLSRRLLIRYISQPYTFFLGRNTAHLGTSLLTEVQQVVHRGHRPRYEDGLQNHHHAVLSSGCSLSPTRFWPYYRDARARRRVRFSRRAFAPKT